MKIIKVNFSIATQYVGSTHSVTKTFEFDDEDSEKSINEEISETYDAWLNDNNYGGWTIESEEIVKDEDE